MDSLDGALSRRPRQLRHARDPQRVPYSWASLFGRPRIARDVVPCGVIILLTCRCPQQARVQGPRGRRADRGRLLEQRAGGVKAGPRVDRDVARRRVVQRQHGGNRADLVDGLIGRGHRMGRRASDAAQNSLRGDRRGAKNMRIADGPAQDQRQARGNWRSRAHAAVHRAELAAPGDGAAHGS